MHELQQTKEQHSDIGQAKRDAQQPRPLLGTGCKWRRRRIVTPVLSKCTWIGAVQPEQHSALLRVCVWRREGAIGQS